MRERNYFVLITQRRILKIIGAVGSTKVSTTGKIFTEYRLSIRKYVYCAFESR
jgi:hypothetical protein